MARALFEIIVTIVTANTQCTRPTAIHPLFEIIVTIVTAGPFCAFQKHRGTKFTRALFKNIVTFVTSSQAKKLELKSTSVISRGGKMGPQPQPMTLEILPKGSSPSKSKPPARRRRALPFRSPLEELRAERSPDRL
jgi:hypothetical protein